MHFGLIDQLFGLTFPGRQKHPGGTRIFDAIQYRLQRCGKGLAALAGNDTDLEPALIFHPFFLKIRQFDDGRFLPGDDNRIFNLFNRLAFDVFAAVGRGRCKRHIGNKKQGCNDDRS